MIITIERARFSKLLLAGIVIISAQIVFLAGAQAQEGDASPGSNIASPVKVVATATPLPQSGSLSNSSKNGSKGVASQGQWGGSDPLSGKAPPITGSVSKAGPKNWTMKLYNNTEDSYSVTVQVAQFNLRGTKIKADNFSYSLKARQSVERAITSGQGVDRASLELTSWKKTSQGKAEGTEIVEGQTIPGAVVKTPIAKATPTPEDEYDFRAPGTGKRIQ